MPRHLSSKPKITYVLAYLRKNRLMSLATSANRKPWQATVFFAYDKNINLVFFSREDTKHCQHIKENPYVAIAINHDWQEGRGLVRGLQITGRASKVSGEEREKYYALYKSRMAWADDFASDHVLYAIKPIEVWYINQKLFGHGNRVRVI